MVVRQAGNVLDLLEYFAQRRLPATLSEISDDLGWPRSSTFNLIETLNSRGYICTPGGRFAYYPTPKWKEAFDTIVESSPLPTEIIELVESFARETGETVSLAAPAGINVVLVHVVESQSVIRYSADVGKLLPIHATAAGRAILSQYSDTLRNSLLAKVAYERYQPNSLTSRDDVLLEVKKSEERGWFQSNTEFTADVSGLAFKLPMPGRKMAMAIGGPSFRMQPRIHELGTLGRQRVEATLKALRDQ
jgi:IclR family acetate operon transcriptional repressor